MASNIYQIVLDSLAAHVAILDEHGEIIETNKAWQNFGSNNGLVEPFDCVGTNYLAICETASSTGEKDAGNVAKGIRDVLDGKVDHFFTQYPCHSPLEKRWYVVRVVPYRGDETKRVIVTHENITPIMEIQETLEKKEEQLEQQAEKLEETNIALKILLEQRNEDRRRIEENVHSNVNRLALPYLEKLMQSKLNQRQKTLAEITHSNLLEIVSPFLSRLSTLNNLLTPQEIEVAHMVRSGKTSKEIAEVLYLSVAGVDFHRKKIRNKLGLTNSSTNLRSYLLSLE